MQYMKEGIQETLLMEAKSLLTYRTCHWQLLLDAWQRSLRNEGIPEFLRLRWQGVRWNVVSPCFVCCKLQAGAGDV